MGNHVSIDSVPLDELVSFKPPAAAPPPLKYRSNVKLWRFYATDKPLQVKSAPIEPGFTGFDASECYIILHIYKRQDARVAGSGAAGRSSVGGVGSSGTASTASGGSGTRVSELASSCEQCLSPRGCSAPFSGYDDCGPYLEQRGGGGGGGDCEPLAHDIYVWNGRSALALTKAVALTKCFELERTLINDEQGVIRHMHRGMGRTQQPLETLYSADYTAPTGAAENHLLATLCKHAGSEAIECSSLLACMLPGLTALSTSTFPDLHRALSSHAKPSSPSVISPAQSSHSPPATPSAAHVAATASVAGMPKLATPQPSPPPPPASARRRPLRRPCRPYRSRPRPPRRRRLRRQPPRPCRRSADRSGRAAPVPTARGVAPSLLLAGSARLAPLRCRRRPGPAREALPTGVRRHQLCPS